VYRQRCHGIRRRIPNCGLWYTVVSTAAHLRVHRPQVPVRPVLSGRFCGPPRRAAGARVLITAPARDPLRAADGGLSYDPAVWRTEQGDGTGSSGVSRKVRHPPTPRESAVDRADEFRNPTGAKRAAPGILPVVGLRPAPQGGLSQVRAAHTGGRCGRIGSRHDPTWNITWRGRSLEDQMRVGLRAETLRQKTHGRSLAWIIHQG
jgi:hypothetical protein